MPNKDVFTKADSGFRPSGAPRGAKEDPDDIRRAQSTAGGELPESFDAWSATGGRDSEAGGHDNVSGYGSRRADPTFGADDVQRVDSLDEEGKKAKQEKRM